eukprot:gene2873-3164_t
MPWQEQPPLSAAEGPDVRLCPDGTDPSSLAVFEAEHSALLESQATIVVRFDDSDMELVFVPVKVKTGSTSTGAAYWGYTVPAHLLNLASTALHCGRLLVVFDLDETLVMAHTVDSLSQRIRRVNAAKEAKAAELRSFNSSNSSDEQSLLQKQHLLQAELALLDAEVQLLQADFEMLDYYRRDMSCRVLVKGPGAHSRLAEPSWEKVYNSQGVELTRPVVRVEAGGRPLIFTRIDPANRKTSVLLRLRPNWWQLKDYLSGMEDVRAGMQRRQRWEVFICTTAEKEYAMEAWRLLDPDFSIFGREELLLKRMLCVPHPQKKDLLNVLRQELINLERVSNPFGPATMKLLTDEARGLKAAISTAQLTVVVDDRADVWDQASRKALLQVMPFHPHKEAAALDMGPAAAPPDDYEAAKDSEAELVRVMQTLKELRSKFYSQLDMEIKPEAQRLVSLGLTELLQASPLEILPPIRPVSELLAESSCKPPAALGLTEREDRASDLRLAATPGLNNSIGTAGTAAGPGAGGGVLQQLPPHPLAACNNPTMLHMPPADVVSVLRGAAAACASPDDLAAYQELFPLALQGLASPGQLLEVLGIISCRLSISHEAALQQIITDNSFRLLKQLQQLMKVDKEVSKFLLPADPMQSDEDWNQQHQKQQALDLTIGHSADQPNQQQGYPPFPTPELLERLGHAPDSFSYAYEAMQAAAAHIDVQSLLQSNANKSAADVVWQLTYRGPRIEYLWFQGDRRPGKVQRSPDPCFTCVLHYWGKNWGYGYASKKKAAKRQAAEDALGNMWVSGLSFDRLPKIEMQATLYQGGQKNRVVAQAVGSGWRPDLAIESAAQALLNVRPPGHGPGSSGFIAPHSSSSSQMPAGHGGQMNVQGLMALGTPGAPLGLHEQQQHHAFPSPAQPLQQALPTLQAGVQGMVLPPQFAQHQQQQHMGMPVGVPAVQQFAHGAHSSQPPWRVHAQGQQPGADHYKQQNMGGMHGRMQGR